MPTWEYQIWRVNFEMGRIEAVDGEDPDIGDRRPMYQDLARAGKEGWELVGLSGVTLIFKRPLVED